MMRKYIKSKLLFFLILTGISFCFFKLLGTTEARDNAFLASFIDEDSCMYKFQVIYSGSEVELARISAFLNEDSMLTQNGRISILKNFVQNSVKTDNNSMVTPKDGAPGTAEVADYELAVGVNSDPDRDKTGHFTFKIYDKLGDQSYDVKSFDFTKFDKEFEKTKAKPMTFPFDSAYNASTSDINRAYKVMDTICNDFTEALLYINSGKSFTSVDSLIETAYYLVTAGSDNYGGSAVIQNEYGNKFKIDYNSSAKSKNGLLNNQVTITEVSSKASNERSRTFTWRCKKGYKGYEKGDQLEDGESNTLTISDSANEHDTEYITWEHLFIEAGLLYAEGVSYSNAADIFTTDVNIVYILRQFFIPALMIISPICIIAYGFGPKGKMICGNWIKQLIGVIFIQGFHALVYGFIVTNSVGLRGIESLITCASFIPLTAVFSNLFGISPTDMLRQASSTTNTARAGLSGAVAVGTGAVSGALSGAANIADKVGTSKNTILQNEQNGRSFTPSSSTVTGSMLRGLSGATRFSGGSVSTGLGAGYDLALQDQSGTTDMQRGFSSMSSGISDMATGLGAAGASEYLSKFAKEHPPLERESNKDDSNSYKGVDIGCKEGTPIYAAADGIVEISQYSSSAGNYVQINHGSNAKGETVQTVYMHNSSLLVKSGDQVKKGQEIAKAGSTGYSTGSHCHFGLMINGIYSNPVLAFDLATVPIMENGKLTTVALPADSNFTKYIAYNASKNTFAQ